LSEHHDGASVEQLRELFHRKALATERHRGLVARALGISDAEATALAHLARHGSLTPGELGRLLGLSSGGMTALLHRLEAAGFIERRPHPSDRRSAVLLPTPVLLERATELYGALVRGMDAASQRLSEAERLVVARYLTEIVEVSEREADAMAAQLDARAADLVPNAPTPGLWA